jgi:uncharacterized protein (DUF3820 family)
MDDNSRMPWGKYKNEKMANVPADYLLWLLKENKCAGDVKRYIETNVDILQEEIATAKKQKK